MVWMAPSGLLMLDGVRTSQVSSDGDKVLVLLLFGVCCVAASGIESMDGLDIGWVVAVEMVAEPVMVDR